MSASTTIGNSTFTFSAALINALDKRRKKERRG
jgi:hypothetical protein